MTTTEAAPHLAVRVLTAAFADDPLRLWLLPGLPAEVVFEPLVQASAEQGELAVAPDGTAAAAWLARGPEPAEPAADAVPEELARLRLFLELTEPRHPSGRAHLYLAFLGVLPGAQGRGLGGALLRERLTRADAEGLPAYLEATSPRSRALYARHGFGDVGDPIALPDGPTLWPMRRPVRP